MHYHKDQVDEEAMEIIAPDVLEKLVKHFSEDSGIRVVFDPEPGAIPRTASNGTVIIPTWIRRGALTMLLGSALHESAHVQYDKKAMKMSEIIRNPPAWFRAMHNVVLDARADGRRIDQFAGVAGIYSEMWNTMSQRDEKDPEGKSPLCATKGLLAESLGLGGCDFYRELTAPISNKKEIVDFLRGLKDKDGTLIREAFMLLKMLGMAEGMPPPPQPSGGNAPPEEQEKAQKTLEQMLGSGKTTKDLLFDGEFRDAASKTAKKVFGRLDFEQPTDHNGVAHGCGFSRTGNEKLLKIDPSEIATVKSKRLEEAVRTFVEVADSVSRRTDFMTAIDLSQVHNVFTEPETLMVSDVETVDTATVVDLVVDLSGSMSSGLPEYKGGPTKTNRRTAVVKMADLWATMCKDLGVRNVHVGTIGFSTHEDRVVPFTYIDDLAYGGIGWALKSAPNMGGGTNATPAVERSIRELLEMPAKRRAIIILTDGEVDGDFDGVLEKAANEGIFVTTMLVGNDFSAYGDTRPWVNRVAATVDQLELSFAADLIDASFWGRR